MVQSDAAVAFLTRSKLPIETLKAVWAAADQPVANALDARKFAVAVRLVQLAQHNLPQLAALLAPPQQQSQPIDLAQGFPPNLRPAFFEGIPPPPEAAAATSMPAPPQQQQQQPSGMTGGGSVAGGGASVAGSMVPPQSMAPHTPQQQQQLTVQDPYTLTPAELLRYEQMFPEYCSPNDSHYMYGPEAVALFQKSGLPREALSRIWTLVDTDPVDNRLDPMEFALAMHLIVCVSKKNLPLPTALPPSMAYLKKQQQQQQPEHHRGAAAAGIPPANATHAQQQQHPHPEAPSVLAPSSFPSGQMNMAPSVTMMSMGGGAAASVTSAPPRSVMMAPTAATNNTLSGLAGPPPLTHQVGGLSISDAFEGLGGGGAGDTGSISDYHATNQHSTAHPTTTMAANMEASASSPMHAYSHPPPHQQQQQLSAVTTLEHDDEDEVNGEHAAHRVPVPATVKTTAQLAASYDMGGASEELVKLRNALQKLQAENISLKAKMGSMTDEERDVQKELSATVAEVSNLANELTQTRAQVLASKSRLLESTAELKAAKEKKG